METLCARERCQRVAKASVIANLPATHLAKHVLPF